MSLRHHQAAAPALPLDQSCLPEESASATRAHNNNNNNNSNSHHSSPTFSNNIPEFMESVIDSVSISITYKKDVMSFDSMSTTHFVHWSTVTK